MIIENDREPVGSLHLMLSQAGFTVSTVNQVEYACDAVDREHPHLVMVDWDMPGAVTTNLVRHIRSQGTSGGPRLIALSSFAGEQHVVSGFELGLDDYVIKPYSVAELIARVKAVLRASRRQEHQSGHLQFCELRMDTGDNRVTVGDKAVCLRHMEFVLLEFLMRHPERAYSRELLLNRVWGGDCDAGLRAVDVTVQRVRRALNPHGCGDYLQTIRGVGYRLSVGSGR